MPSEPICQHEKSEPALAGGRRCGDPQCGQLLPDQPIRPEDIRPGDWVRFHDTSVAIVERRPVYKDGPSDHLLILSSPWVVLLSDVLEVRRG